MEYYCVLGWVGDFLSFYSVDNDCYDEYGCFVFGLGE